MIVLAEETFCFKWGYETVVGDGKGGHFVPGGVMILFLLIGLRRKGTTQRTPRCAWLMDRLLRLLCSCSYADSFDSFDQMNENK